MPIDINHIIARLDQIPTLPIVSRHIMTLLGEKDLHLGKLSRLIEKDQALAVKILKVANSAFYGTLSKVVSIEHALAVLGLEEVKGILLAFSVQRFFTPDPRDGFDRSRFWRHSVVCSQVAKYLARHFQISGGESLFLSALIHDIGKIVLDHYFHEEFGRILDYISEHGATFTKAEREILGTTHYQVAARLLQQWNFPPQVIYQVFYHHAPWEDEDHPSGSTVIYLADRLTKWAGFTCLETEGGGDVLEFGNSKAMVRITESGFDLDTSVVENLLLQVQELIAEEGESMLDLFGG
ncbi:MAG: HDOD domain-containing protein [Thermodesulfobacteriota bacterium]